MRALILLVAVAVLASSADAQNFDTLPAPGRLMRVNVAIPRAAFYEGRVLAYTQDTLVLKVAGTSGSGDTTTVPIPRRAVSLAHISTGVDVAPYVWTGAIGAGFLSTVFVAGILLDGGGLTRGQYAMRAAAIGAAGAVVGGLLGLRSAPPRWLRVDVRPHVQGH